MSQRYESAEEKYVRVNATADGDNTLITNSDPDKAIVVLSYALNVNAAGVVTLQDSSASPAIYASFELTDGGGVSYGGPRAAFKVAKGKNLEVSDAAGVDCLGHITYCLVGR